MIKIESRYGRIASVMLLAGLLVFSAFEFVACGDGKSGGAGSSAGSASGELKQSVAFVVVKSQNYGPNGEQIGTIIYDYDEHGNALSRSMSDSSGKESVTRWESFDENGYATLATTPDGQGISYEIVVDGGKLVKSTGSDGSVAEYTYYDNGAIKEVITRSANGFESIAEYDEKGLPIKRSSVQPAGSKSETTYTWEFDSAKAPISLVITSDSNAGGPSGSYTVECDANGNITRLIDASSGNQWVEYEYAKIENPSASCSLTGSLVNI